VSDCKELVGVTWRLSDCEELSGGYLQEMMGLVLGGLLFYSISPFTNLYSFFPLLL